MSNERSFHDNLLIEVRPYRYDNYPQFMAACEQRLEGLEAAESPIEHLNELEQQYWSSIASALGKSPQKTLQQYGERVLAWTSLRYPNFSAPDFRAAMAQTNYDEKRFERAGSWGRYVGRHHFAFTEAQYELSQQLETRVQELPIQEIITDNLRPGIKPKQLGAYSLRSLEQTYLTPHGGLHEDPRPFSHNIYLDTPLGFAICYKEIPQAVGGISLSSLNELMIYQMQGVKVRHPQSGRGLARLNWQAAVIDIAERITTDSGLAFTGIQAAEHNRYVKPRYANGRNLTELRKIYDLPAMQQGYWQGKDNDWHIHHAPQIVDYKK